MTELESTIPCPDPRDDLSSPDEETRRTAVVSLATLPLPASRALLFRAMGDESWRVRKEAVEVYLSSPEAGDYIEELFSLLRSQENAGLRNSSVEALVRLGRLSLPVLEAHAADADRDVRKFVIDAIGSIGDRSSLPLLIRALGDDDSNVCTAAAENLGKMGGAGTVKPLLDALSRPDLTLRYTILEALGRMGEPIPVDILVPFLSEKLLKKTVYECLGSTGGADAVPLLLSGLAEPARNVRETVVKALMDVCDRLPSATVDDSVTTPLRRYAGSPMAAGLIALLDNADPELHRALIRMFGLMGECRAASPILKACRNERLQSVCLESLRAMGSVTVTFLEEEYDSSEDGDRETILRICAEMAMPGSSPLVSRGMRQISPAVRESAARAAARLGLTDLIPEIAVLLNESDQEVHAAALEALAYLARLDAPAVAVISGQLVTSPDPAKRREGAVLAAALRDGERLARLVKDEDDTVRRMAVQGFSGFQGDDALHHLTIALTDENPEVRIAAASVLGGSGIAEALDPLVLASRDEDPWVCCAALRGLGKLGDPRALGEIESALGSGQGMVVLSALEALADIGDERSRELVRETVTRCEGDIVRTAVEILAEWEDPWLDAHGEELLRHPDWNVRNSIVRFFGERRGRAAAPLLRRVLETEKDDLVRDRIISILERYP
jgi:HEAT repeat protein